MPLFFFAITIIPALLKPQLKNITMRIRPTHKKMVIGDNWKNTRKMFAFLKNNDLIIKI